MSRGSQPDRSLRHMHHVICMASARASAAAVAKQRDRTAARERELPVKIEKKSSFQGSCFLFPDLPVVFCLTAEKCCEWLHGQGHFYQLLSPEAVPAVQQRKPMK